MKRRALVNPIAVFVLAQLVWFALVGLWIYWYVSNYLLLSDAMVQITFEGVVRGKNITALVGGLVLLVALATAMALIFGKLSNQIRLTSMYDNFIANITHELKSPLASIQLYLETMDSRELPPEKKNEFVKLMIEDSNRLNNLISSILQVAVLEEKRSVFELHEFDADEFILSLIEGARTSNKLPPDAVTVYGKAGCRIRADSTAMNIVVNNLFDNAVKYCVGSARIAVSISRNYRWLVIEIRDNGIGISQKDQKLIFRKFQRIYSPESPNVKGTGLGLFWVREIIRHHRGKVSVASEGKGFGTTFKLEIPAVRSGVE